MSAAENPSNRDETVSSIPQISAVFSMSSPSEPFTLVKKPNALKKSTRKKKSKSKDSVVRAKCIPDQKKEKKRFYPSETCEICSKPILKTNLIRHLKRHIGEKPFVCDICGRALSEKHALIKHKEWHVRMKKLGEERRNASETPSQTDEFLSFLKSSSLLVQKAMALELDLD